VLINGLITEWSRETKYLKRKGRKGYRKERPEQLSRTLPSSLSVLCVELVCGSIFQQV